MLSLHTSQIPEIPDSPARQQTAGQNRRSERRGRRIRGEYSEYTAIAAFAGHESDCSAIDLTQDPDDRRRLDKERQMQRDAEIARLRRLHTPRHGPGTGVGGGCSTS
jgi:hypothetical protein